MTDNPKLNSKQFMFSLVRLRPECKIPITFVDFTPLFRQQVFYSALKLQLDRLFLCSMMTAATLLTHFYFLQKRYLLKLYQKTQAKSTASEKLYFEHRIRQSISSSMSGVTPNVIQKIEELAPTSNYCQICQEFFKSYDDHLEQKTHFLRWHHN